MATTISAEPTRGSTAARTHVHPLRQLLRLSRTELTLVYRYRMALFIGVFPLLFVYVGTMMEGDDVLPGIDAAAHFIAGTPVLCAMVVGIWHISNVYAARREQLILKRFRASGVTPFALFGASTLAVLAVVALLTVIIGALLAGLYGVWPTDPLLVVLTLVVTGVTMSLAGAGFTRFARNAESAQLLSMLPFLFFYAASGLMVPLEMMPDRVVDLMRLLPMAPAVELVQSGYLGHDLTAGLAEASEATGIELWAAAAPNIGLLLVWLALSVFFLRYFRWDPRQAR